MLFATEFYEPLFKFSGAIDYFNSQLLETKNPFKKSKLKKQSQRLTEAFDASLEEHAEVAVASESLSDIIVDSVRADLLEITNSTRESWNQAINDVETRLMPSKWPRLQRSMIRRCCLIHLKNNSTCQR